MFIVYFDVIYIPIVCVGHQRNNIYSKAQLSRARFRIITMSTGLPHYFFSSLGQCSGLEAVDWIPSLQPSIV